MINWLNQLSIPEFPSTKLAHLDPNGLLASGGSVSPVWLDQAYRHGIFPWNNPGEQRLWWSPSPRAVILPENFRIPRTVRKLLKKEHLITSNLAFRRVMEACAEPRDKEAGTWISHEMIDSYERLFNAGRALSVEYWDSSGNLSGGFYGLIIGQALFGESMFSRVSNASKLCFAKAAPILFQSGIQLIDCQMHTDHLAQFGLIELPRDEFESVLNSAVIQQPTPILPTIL